MAEFIKAALNKPASINFSKSLMDRLVTFLNKPGSNLVPMTKREFKEIKKFGKESATKSIISTLKDLE